MATRYVAKFMHQTGLLVQFQHTGREDSDEEPDQDLPEAMEQSPGDAGYSPTHAPTDEDGEDLGSLFEYTIPE